MQKTFTKTAICEEFLDLKSFSRSLAGESEGGSPRILTNFKILQRIKVLENESIFQTVHISIATIIIFLRKISKNWRNFIKLSKIFWKIILKF